MAKFVIGIGGTGMRCLESFIHLCAMGMFGDEDIHILALDTDAKNGNFKRVDELAEAYKKIHKEEEKTKSKDTFFSSKISWYKFGPEYGPNCNFEKISQYGFAREKVLGNSGHRYKTTDLCELFLTKEVRQMDLEHGYRAQTQMGSMLMYHAIIEAAYKHKKNPNGLGNFVEKLANCSKSKVFIFGSVFGGTGASSIPIIPRALDKAAKIINEKNSRNIIDDNFFGASLLTNYFSFTRPSNKDNQVVASCDNFSLNSQAALYFYAQDETIRKQYNRMYLIGRENMRDIITTNDSSDTGGAKQKNPVDYLELLCATAAHDFFNDSEVKEDKDNRNSADHLPLYCRTISYENALTERCFFDNEKTAWQFEKKLGMLISFDFLNSINSFASIMKEKGYDITEDEIKYLNEYFQYFYNLNSKEGWLYQMYESTRTSGDDLGGFLFNNAVFEFQKEFQYNKNLFTPKNDFFESTFKVGIFNNPNTNQLFDKVTEEFLKKETGEKNLSSLISGVYETFDSLFATKKIK